MLFILVDHFRGTCCLLSRLKGKVKMEEGIWIHGEGRQGSGS
jgi:hypothetical protein